MADRGNDSSRMEQSRSCETIFGMNSFAAGLNRIAQIARSGVLGNDSAWLAAGIEIYVARAANDWPLDRALSLAWSNECRARRDSALREYAARYCREALFSRCAVRLGNDLRIYERGTWRHDRHRVEMPSSYVGTPRELLFRAFRENESIRPQRDIASSPGHLEKILSHCAGDGMSHFDPPIPITEKDVSDASNNGDQDHAREKVRTFDQRRRGRDGDRRASG